MFQSVQSTGSKFKLACFRQRSKPGFLWMCTPKIPGNIDALFPTCSFIPCLFGASIFSEAPLFKLAINAQASLSRNCSVLNFFLFFSWVQHFCLKNGGFTLPKMADYWDGYSPKYDSIHRVWPIPIYPHFFAIQMLHSMTMDHFFLGVVPLKCSDKAK